MLSHFENEPQINPSWSLSISVLCLLWSFSPGAQDPEIGGLLETAFMQNMLKMVQKYIP
jgi:hypothetical protein